jgi:hypothetical protein
MFQMSPIAQWLERQLRGREVWGLIPEPGQPKTWKLVVMTSLLDAQDFGLALHLFVDVRIT